MKIKQLVVRCIPIRSPATRKSTFKANSHVSGCRIRSESGL